MEGGGKSSGKKAPASGPKQIYKRGMRVTNAHTYIGTHSRVLPQAFQMIGRTECLAVLRLLRGGAPRR
jgi:hypothetical protein